jgi:negative regulator of flagellin synthesis FlgM
MPPIEVGAARAIGAVSPELTRRISAETATDSATVNASPAQATVPQSTQVDAKPAIATSEALDPGKEPVDIDRVAQIRKAVESGSYPLVPARIADAMIAAGMFLRSSKA